MPMKSLQYRSSSLINSADKAWFIWISLGRPRELVNICNKCYLSCSELINVDKVYTDIRGFSTLTVQDQLHWTGLQAMYEWKEALPCDREIEVFHTSGRNGLHPRLDQLTGQHPWVYRPTTANPTIPSFSTKLWVGDPNAKLPAETRSLANLTVDYLDGPN